MAIFSYMMGDRVSRGHGQSAVKAAAYQAREKYRDERTGYSYNSLPHEGAGGHEEGRKAALFVGLYAPKEAPQWCCGKENIEQLWSRAELAERRKDAQIAERIIIALPHELSLQQNVWLLQDHIEEFTRQGRVVQVAIHAPEHGDKLGAEKNVHAHLLVSMRGVDGKGFKATKEEARHRYLHRREYVAALRERWAATTNRHLARHGHEARIDPRTLREQGIERAPTSHLGPGDSRRERRGERSAAGEINREIAAMNAERARPAPDRAHAEQHRGAAHERTEPPGQKAAQAQKVVEAPEAPEAANTASGSQERRQERDPTEAETVDLDIWRQELEHEAAAAQPAAVGEQPRNPLYERYQRERESTWQARREALTAHRERFDQLAEAIRKWDRGVHAVIYDFPLQDRRVERLLQQNRRAEAWIEFRAAERAQRQEIKDRHMPLAWSEWLEKEGARGAEDARQAIARQEHKAREELRVRLHAMDDVELWRAVRADTGAQGWPLTVEEVAGELAPTYRWAADDLATLRQEAKDADLERRHEQRNLEAATEAIEKRRAETSWWQRMLGGDAELVRHEDAAGNARNELARFDVEAIRRTEQIAGAEKAMGEAFAAIKDRAERELQDRQQTAVLAKEVRDEREAAREAERPKDRALERDRDDELER